MKHVIIQASCDLCEGDPPSADISQDIGLDLNGKAVNLDLCSTHEDILNKALGVLGGFIQVGTPVARKAKKAPGTRKPTAQESQDDPSRTLKCPDCDFRSPAPQGIGTHRAAAHGYISPNSGADRKRRQRAAAAVDRQLVDA